jgi:2-dehydropantoate 2-reductase
LVHLSSGHIDFGELDGRESDRAKAIAEIFRRAGIMGELSHNIMLLRWDKLVWNGAFNTVTTLTRRRVGALLDDPEGLRLVCKLMREIIDAARAEDYQIGYERIDSYLEHPRKNLRELKTSTQLDLERGKRLEYEALAGAVVRAARRRATISRCPRWKRYARCSSCWTVRGPRSSPVQRRSHSVKLCRSGTFSYLFSNCLFPNRLFHDS